MSVSAPAPDATVDPVVLRRSLRAFGAPPVELRETHGSWVFLTPSHAFKLKKPLRFDFADLRRAEARERACEEEVRANQALAGPLDYRLRGVALSGDGYAVVPPDDPGVVERLVVSRRFDEHDTLAARVDAGPVPPDDVERIGATIARFHADAPRRAGRGTDRDVVAANLDGLEAVADGRVPAGEIAALRRFGDAFLDGWEEVLRGRSATGRVVDGHGDLRAEHVLLQDDRVVVLDRLDLPHLRAVDVADDLAFLCMDLEARGVPELAGALVDGYVAAGGERPPRELLAFFSVHRAAVRAKVALVRARQPGAAAHDGHAEARRLLALAARCAARARGENVVVVSGPPAVGKSTVAAALAERTGLPVLRSDEIRPSVGTGYDLAGRAAVYAELGRRARGLAGCIVDATFGAPALRHAFLAELDRDQRRRVFAVECRARPVTLARRAKDRLPSRRFGSEADVAVAARLAESFSPFDELAPRDRLAADAEGDLTALGDAVLAWLDAHLADGRLS